MSTVTINDFFITPPNYPKILNSSGLATAVFTGYLKIS
jgi:hypothetical protein